MISIHDLLSKVSHLLPRSFVFGFFRVNTGLHINIHYDFLSSMQM